MGPEGWMASSSHDAPNIRGGGESIRAWYQRTTRNWRKALVWCSMSAVAFSFIFYFAASRDTHLALQVFNGAIVIPIAAFIWILAFVYIFLVPNREAGFRSQEALETAVDRMRPGLAVWQRVGERVERELPAFLDEFRSGLATVKEAAARIEAAAGKNDRLAEEAKPAVEALRRISERMDREVRTGLVEDMRAACEAVKGISGVPKDPTEPDIRRALASIRRRG